MVRLDPLGTIAAPAPRGRAGVALVEPLARAPLALAGADFEVRVYRDLLDGAEHLALSHGDPRGATAPLIRIHSECLIGDLLGGERCRCRARLEAAIGEIAEADAGVLVYVRGVGTVAAGLAAGRCGDGCDEEVAVRILADLGLASDPLLGPAAVGP